jgi:uncharacterized protein YceK
MKGIALTLFVVLLLAGCHSGVEKQASSDISADTGRAVLVFDEYEHHFGKVEEGRKVSWSFKYHNEGTGPLVLNTVLTTCGCTVPKYNTKPSRPGDSGNIEVVFDTTERNGMQSKTITVRSNATKPVILLKITADVIQK